MKDIFYLKESVQKIPEVKDWLNQFSENDQTTALDFLRSFQFVPDSVYREYIEKEILEIQKDKKKGIAIFARHKFPKEIKYYFEQDKQGNVIKSKIKGIGSEDLVSLIIRNITRRTDVKILNTPSIENMRNEKINDIIILDDCIMSGNSLKKFLELFFNHSSMKSWFSLKNSKIYIITYAYNIDSKKNWHSAKIGKKDFNKYPSRLEKISIKNKITISSEKYPEWLKPEFRELCCKYNRGDYSLGYDGFTCNIIYEHSCPNNVPGILWQSSSNPQWKGLFMNRSISSALFSKLINCSSSEQPDIKYGAYINKKILNNNLDIYLIINEILNEIEIYSNFDHLIERCACKIRCSIEYVKNIYEILQKENYISSDGFELTNKGMELMKYMKSKRRKLMVPEFENKPYYPKI